MTRSSFRKLRIFLCHASDDKPRIRDLHKQLITNGYDVWLDEIHLLPGQDWRYEIPRAVRESDVVIVCLSGNSVNKEGYVQKEIKFALDVAEEKPEGTIFIIPLRLEVCDVPERLNKWQWVDLYEDKGFEKLNRSLTIRSEHKKNFKSVVPQKPPIDNKLLGTIEQDFSYGLTHLATKAVSPRRQKIVVASAAIIISCAAMICTGVALSKSSFFALSRVTNTSSVQPLSATALSHHIAQTDEIISSTATLLQFPALPTILSVTPTETPSPRPSITPTSTVTPSPRPSATCTSTLVYPLSALTPFPTDLDLITHTNVLDIHVLREFGKGRFIFSPDWKYVATDSYQYEARKFAIGVFMVTDGSLIRRFENSGRITTMVFSQDDKLLAVATDAKIYIWNVLSGNLLQEIDADSAVKELKFTRSGEIITMSDHKFEMWKLGEYDPVLSIDIKGYFRYDNREWKFSPLTGIYLAFAYDETTVQIWNIDTKELIKTLNNVIASNFVFSPDEKLFIYKLSDRLRVLDLMTPLHTTDLNMQGTDVLAFSPDKLQAETSALLLVSRENVIDIFGYKSMGNISNPLDNLEIKHLRTVNIGMLLHEIIISPDGKLIAAGTYGNELIRLSDGENLTKLSGDIQGFSLDGNLLTTVSDGRLYLWGITNSPSNKLPLDYQCLDLEYLRLSLGVQAVVNSNNMRLVAYPPNDTNINPEIVSQISQGSVVTISSDPVCYQGSSWWRVNTESGLTGWIQEWVSGSTIMMPIKTD